jgi:hypothetical protein
VAGVLTFTGLVRNPVAAIKRGLMRLGQYLTLG